MDEIKVVYIEWIDSVGSDSGWKELDRDKFKSNLSRIISYGLLIHEDEEKIILASAYCPGDIYQIESVMGQIIIPKKCIIEAQRYKQSELRKPDWCPENGFEGILK